MMTGPSIHELGPVFERLRNYDILKILDVFIDLYICDMAIQIWGGPVVFAFFSFKLLLFFLMALSALACSGHKAISLKVTLLFPILLLVLGYLWSGELQATNDYVFDNILL